MGKQKKHGSHTVPVHGKPHPHHQHHHQQKPEAPAHEGAYNSVPAWSPVVMTESFAYTALQGPNGQPLGWKISGVNAYPPSNTRSYSSTWPSGHQSAAAYGPSLAPHNVPTAAQQPGGGGISAGVSTSSSDRSGHYAHSGGDSDTGSSSDDSGSASHSEVRKKKVKVKSSSSHRHRGSSRQPSRHRRHRSRSAHRSRGHGHDRQAEREAHSHHKVDRWLGHDRFSEC